MKEGFRHRWHCLLWATIRLAAWVTAVCATVIVMTVAELDNVTAVTVVLAGILIARQLVAWLTSPAALPAPRRLSA